jgi:hypothetical protein
MITFSTLTSRFLDWMGIVDVTATETLRVEEILNAAVGLVYSEGISGLQRAMTGKLRSNLTATVAAHTAESSLITFDAPLVGVNPNDVVTIAGDEYIIAAVLSATQIDLGIPLADATGTIALTIQRRSLALSGKGQVVGVGRGNAKYENSSLGAVIATGAGKGSYLVGYNTFTDTAFVTILAGLQVGGTYRIVQAPSHVDGADLDLPSDLVLPIILRAFSLWRMANDEDNPTVAGLTKLAGKDARDLVTNKIGGDGVYVA